MDVDDHENSATMNGTHSETNGSDFPEINPPLQQEDQEDQNPSVLKPERKGYQSRLILTGHTMSVSALKFSPDGSFLASASADTHIKLWDAYTGAILHTLSGHEQGINDIAWSPDGDFLASASDDKTVRVWGMEFREQIKVLTGHTSLAFCLNWNPHSNLLVSGGYDETVRVWDVARGKSLKDLAAHSDPVTSVCFNHDGTLIASCGMDGLIRIWDAESGQCLKTLVDDDNPICSHVRFTPNSRFVLVSTQDSTIRLWNYETSRCVKTYSGHTNRTYCIPSCISSVIGSVIVSGSEDGKVYIWDLQSRVIEQVLEGHKDVVLAVATHPTKPIIASTAMDKDLSIRVWCAL